MLLIKKDGVGYQPSAVFRISLKCHTNSVTTDFRNIFSSRCGPAAVNGQSQTSSKRIIPDEIQLAGDKVQ